MFHQIFRQQVCLLGQRICSPHIAFLQRGTSALHVVADLFHRLLLSRVHAGCERRKATVLRLSSCRNGQSVGRRSAIAGGWKGGSGRASPFSLSSVAPSNCSALWRWREASAGVMPGAICAAGSLAPPSRTTILCGAPFGVDGACLRRLLFPLAEPASVFSFATLSGAVFPASGVCGLAGAAGVVFAGTCSAGACSVCGFSD